MWGVGGRQCTGRRVTRCGRGGVLFVEGEARLGKEQRPRRGEGVGTARPTGGPRPGATRRAAALHDLSGAGLHLARASWYLAGTGQIAVRGAKTSQFGKGGKGWLSC